MATSSAAKASGSVRVSGARRCGRRTFSAVPVPFRERTRGRPHRAHELQPPLGLHGQLPASVGGEDRVLRLDVPVDDARGVDRLEPRGELEPLGRPEHQLAPKQTVSDSAFGVVGRLLRKKEASAFEKAGVGRGLRRRAGRAAPVAVALYLVRESLSQMDVPARSSFITGILAEPDRVAGLGAATLARQLGWAVGPALGAAAAAVAGVAGTLLLGAGVKIVYDLSFFVRFRAVAPPVEERDPVDALRSWDAHDALGS